MTYTFSEQPLLGDDLGITLATLADKDTLGTYDITVTHNDNPNYDITAVNGTYRVLEVPVYVFTLGEDAQWTRGSDETLDFTLQRNYNDEETFANFRGIEADGVAVDSAHYDATRGSVNISLKAAFLDTLAPGEHTLKVLFEDGEAETTFTVSDANEDPVVDPQDAELPSDATEPDTPEVISPPAMTAEPAAASPKTGDAGSAWMLVLFMSAGIATAAVFMFRKKKNVDMK